MLSPSPSLLAHLRDETQDLHTRVETRVDLHGALANRAGYRRVLTRFLGYYDPLEKYLVSWDREWQAIDLAFDPRRKVSFLEADLCRLGLSEPEVALLPRCPFGPVPRTFAEALGCAYVTEGATLGGQLIGRHLDRTLGLRAENGASFFQCYGASVGAMWQQFRRAAESYATRAAAAGHGTSIREQAVAGARQTFQALDCWLAEEEDR